MDPLLVKLSKLWELVDYFEDNVSLSASSRLAGELWHLGIPKPSSPEKKTESKLCLVSGRKRCEN